MATHQGGTFRGCLTISGETKSKILVSGHFWSNPNGQTLMPRSPIVSSHFIPAENLGPWHAQCTLQSSNRMSPEWSFDAVILWLWFMRHSGFETITFFSQQFVVIFLTPERVKPLNKGTSQPPPASQVQRVLGVLQLMRSKCSSRSLRS